MNRIQIAVTFFMCSAVFAAAAPVEKKPSPATKPAKPSNAVVVSRVKLKLDDIESSIVDLLASNQAADVQVQALKVSYRMVIRRLYEAASASKSEELRAQLALRADTLLADASAFDAMVAKVPEWNALILKAGPSPEQQKIKGQLSAAVAATAAFEKATATLGQDLNDLASLRKFMAETFGPLEPAVRVSLNDAAPPTAWPELTSKAVVANEMPTLEATQFRIQQSVILPALRAEMLAVLPQLKAALEKPHGANEAEEEYRVLLDTLSLAEQLGASTALNPEAKADLNERLRKAMILFRDARTRGSATSRLAGVSEIATLLKRLEKSPLTTSQKAILGEQIVLAIRATGVTATAKTGRQTLASLDRFIAASDAFAANVDQPTLPAANADWKKIRTAGESQVNALIDKFSTDPENAKLDHAVKRLDAVVKNLEALAAMPGLVKRAEVLKPKLGIGVERKLNVLARAIADTPDTAGAATEDVRSVGAALTALETARSEMPLEIDAVSIAGDRYKPFLLKFTDAENKLLVALAQPTSVLPPFTAQLNADAKLLKATAQLLAIQKSDLVERLERWGGWKLDVSARTLLLTELTRAIANAYVTSSGGLPSVESAVSTTTAFDSIAVLTEIDRRLGPKLAPKQPANSWALTFSASAKSPSSTAILAGIAPKSAYACFFLNDASANLENASPDDAIAASAKKAIEKLASILPDIQSASSTSGGSPQ